MSVAMPMPLLLVRLFASYLAIACFHCNLVLKKLAKAAFIHLDFIRDHLLPSTLQVFTEAEVRASLVFQVSKLCSFLLKATRLATGAAAWDALVSGVRIPLTCFSDCLHHLSI